MGEHVHEPPRHGEHEPPEHRGEEKPPEGEHGREGGEHSGGETHSGSGHERPDLGASGDGGDGGGTVVHEDAPPPPPDTGTDTPAGSGTSADGGTPPVADPVADATHDLDQLASNYRTGSKPVGNNPWDRWAAMLEQSPPEKAWRDAKKEMLTKIRKSDKKLAQEVERVLKADLAGALTEWSTLMKADPVKGDKILAADQKIAGILGDYERDLAYFEDHASSKLMSQAAIGGLREMLRALARKVSSDTRWLADAGAFG